MPQSDHLKVEREARHRMRNERRDAMAERKVVIARGAATKKPKIRCIAASVSFE
jgi:hypothetical protein